MVRLSFCYQDFFKWELKTWLPFELVSEAAALRG
jgi:hypothetical protein